MIELRDLRVGAGAGEAAFRLSGIDLVVPTGEYAVLMGRSGCGKTTLLETICGLKPALGGRILVDGEDVTERPPAQRGIGFVPQDVALFSHLSVGGNLAFAPKVKGVAAAEVEVVVGELSEALGLGSMLERSTETLSGGERQRVALGRALAARPRVLCLDEPLSALDAETHGEMCGLIQSLARSQRLTVLHITHNPAEAERLADHRFTISQGRLASCNDPT